MAGTLEMEAELGKRHPFRFEITAFAPSTRQHFIDGKAEVAGVIYAPPIVEGAPVSGVITIRPIGQRIIRYELAFVGDDGRGYEVTGQKAIRWTAPLRTFTSLPAEIRDDSGRLIAKCLTAFDLKNHGWSFLRSFRPVR